MARQKTDAATYKKIVLRIPEALLLIGRERAEKAHRSLNAQLLHTIEAGLLFTETLTTEDATRQPRMKHPRVHPVS